MLDLLGACDSEPKQPNAILNLIVIFPLACPKSQKQQKRNPPPPPRGGFLFGTFSLWRFSHVQRPSLLHGRVLEKQRNQDAACFMRAWHAPLCFILNVQHLNIWQRWNVHGDLHQQWMANLSTKSGLSYETSCFGAMIKSKQATKVYFPAMVFKKWEQDCTLVSMLVTLLHLHQREPPTHTKYNHFFHLAKNAWCKEKQSKPAWPQSTQREAGWHSTSGLTMSHKLLWCICAWQQGQNVCWRKKSSLAI